MFHQIHTETVYSYQSVVFKQMRGYSSHRLKTSYNAIRFRTFLTC